MRKTGGTYQPMTRMFASSEQHVAILGVEGAKKRDGSDASGVSVETGHNSEESHSEDVLASLVAILDSLDEWQKSREGEDKVS